MLYLIKDKLKLYLTFKYFVFQGSTTYSLFSLGHVSQALQKQPLLLQMRTIYSFTTRTCPRIRQCLVLNTSKSFVTLCPLYDKIARWIFAFSIDISFFKKLLNSLGVYHPLGIYFVFKQKSSCIHTDIKHFFPQDGSVLQSVVIGSGAIQTAVWIPEVGVAACSNRSKVILCVKVIF